MSMRSGNYNEWHKRQKGSVLFYAVSLSALALLLGASILNIIQRELELSFLSRESQRALYAADTGLECALMWEFDQITFNAGSRPSPGLGVISRPYFATSSPGSSVDGVLGREFCLGQEINAFTNVPRYNDQLNGVAGADIISDQGDWIFGAPWQVDGTSAAATTTFRVFAQTGRYGNALRADMPCAEVRVEKWIRNVWIPSLAAFRDVPMTRIYSEGFSSCAPNVRNRVSRLIVADF